MRRALMTAALAALAACGGDPDAAGPERRSAAGQVLGGEVTDAMLPLDSVRSTSPPDPRAGAVADTASAAPAGKRSGAPSDAAPSAAPEPEPEAPGAADDVSTDGPPPE